MSVNDDSQKIDVKEFIELADKDPVAARMIAYKELKNPYIKSISSTGLRFFMEYMYVSTYYKTMTETENFKESILPILEKYSEDVISTFSNKYIRNKIKKDKDIFVIAAYFGIYIYLLYIAMLKSSNKFNENAIAKSKELMHELLIEYLEMDKQDKDLMNYWNQVFEEL